MVHDSKIWEQAYESFKKDTSNEIVKRKGGYSISSDNKEPMLLLEEYRTVVSELKVLNSKRKEIKQQLKKMGYDASRLSRSDYFNKTILLYVLKLENSCWYIGMTRNVEKRYAAHLKGATIWTKEHPPIKIVEIRDTNLTSDSEAALLENELTLDYARQYGVDVVRGGGYCQRNPDWPPEAFEIDFKWASQ